MMDMNTLRIVVTVASFAAFVAIVSWAWSSRNAERFEDAANQPLDDHE